MVEGRDYRDIVAEVVAGGVALHSLWKRADVAMAILVVFDESAVSSGP